MKAAMIVSTLLLVAVAAIGLVGASLNSTARSYDMVHDQDIPAEVVNYYIKSVYQIVLNQARGGTAFYIGNNQFVTNCHIKSGLKEEVHTITLKNYDFSIELKGDSFICADNDQVDLAIVTYSGETPDSIVYVPPQTIPPYIGKTIYKGGWGGGDSLSLGKGNIQPASPHEPLYLTVSTHTIQGDSGGPIVAFYGDKLFVVGVTTAVTTKEIETFYGTHNVPIPHKASAIPGIVLTYTLRDIKEQLNHEEK
jgi:hypothetical protein